MSYIIETFNLSKTFVQLKSPKDFFRYPASIDNSLAIDRITIQVRKGEVLCLLGANGAGKTTLIKLLCCLILPTSGTARVAGYDILKDGDKIKAFIGLISAEERNFYWRLTGRQNLKFFAALHNLSTQETKNRIDYLGSLFRINAELDKRFYSYSTGVKQRLAIARGLLHDPQVLFIDELAISLDPIMAKDFKVFIKDKLVGEQKKTVIFTTHHLNEVDGLVERLAIMDRGQIKALGTIDELRVMVKNSQATLEEIFVKLTKHGEI